MSVQDFFPEARLEGFLARCVGDIGLSHATPRADGDQTLALSSWMPLYAGSTDKRQVGRRTDWHRLNFRQDHAIFLEYVWPKLQTSPPQRVGEGLFLRHPKDPNQKV